MLRMQEKTAWISPAVLLALVRRLLLRLNFVTAQVLLSLNKLLAAASVLVKLDKLELFRSVLLVFGGVVQAIARFFTDQANNNSFFAFFSHNIS